MSNVSIAPARRPLAMFDWSDDGKSVKITIRQDKYGAHEANADEWIANISRQADQGQYDPSWVAQFKAEYAAFLKGNELPREGTPIRTWALISREQGSRLINSGITTVEDLAAVPDAELMATIGLDGRNLRDLARNFLEAGNGVGGIAKKLADSEQTVRDQAEQIKRMSERLDALESSKKDTLGLPKKAA